MMKYNTKQMQQNTIQFDAIKNKKNIFIPLVPMVHKITDKYYQVQIKSKTKTVLIQ